MSKVLNVVCDMNNGTKRSYSIVEPKDGVTLAQINEAFSVAKEKELFKVDGVKPESVIEANYVETIITEITD